MRLDIRDSSGKFLGYITDVPDANDGCLTALAILCLLPFALIILLFSLPASIPFILVDIPTIPHIGIILLCIFVINYFIAKNSEGFSWYSVGMETCFGAIALFIYFVSHHTSYTAGIEAVTGYMKASHAFFFIPLGITLALHCSLFAFLYSVLSIYTGKIIANHIL